MFRLQGEQEAREERVTGGVVEQLRVALANSYTGLSWEALSVNDVH